MTDKVVQLRPDDDSRLIVTLTVGELRTLIRTEVTKAFANRSSEDRLVDIEEAAKMLCVSTDWLYHERKRLPFAKKIGRKQLRFSVQGMRRWIDSTTR
jgi:predicted DNA-binding transcriptional regulator AlpA